MPVSLLSVWSHVHVHAKYSFVGVGYDLFKSAQCHHYLSVSLPPSVSRSKWGAALFGLAWLDIHCVSHSSHNLPTASFEKEIGICPLRSKAALQLSATLFSQSLISSSHSIKHVFTQRNRHRPQGSRPGIGPIPSWPHRQRHDLRLGHLVQTLRQHVTCVFGDFLYFLNFLTINPLTIVLVTSNFYSSYEGVKENPDGTLELDIKAQTKAVIEKYEEGGQD